MIARSRNLIESIVGAIEDVVADAGTFTEYREPLVGFADANADGFRDMRGIADPSHMLPVDLLAGARSAVSFFVPFEAGVVKAKCARQ